MGIIKTVAIIVLSISFVVFIALFGRLPAFRRTPVGLLHKVLWKHLPNAFVQIDERFTGRRVSRGLVQTGNYLMNEPHPLVLIFFVLLQLVAELLFIPPAWPRLSSSPHYILIPTLVSLPYLFLYLSATTTSAITAASHRTAMLAYPYDYTLFHPGYFCSTCRRPKPARSKHCPICKSCIQKQDHHCIWINNCVGRNNYIWFNLLLVSVSCLLAYGAHTGYGILDARLQARFVPASLTRGSFTAKRWSTRLTWAQYFDCWGWALSVEWRVGAVALLALLSFPLSTGFLAYHAYLIWAGMTTNESAKWGDWKEDIDDGVAYRAEIEELRGNYPPLPVEVEPREHEVVWPGKRRARWWMIRTRNGEPPTRRLKEPGLDPVDGHTIHGERDEVDKRWVKVRDMAEVDNIYDLGFWGTLKESMLHRG